MTEIKRFEEIIAAANKGEKVKVAPEGRTLYWAYLKSKESGNDLIDFNDVIWDVDIPGIAATFRENGIKEFTISSSFSSLIGTLAAFQVFGIKMDGLTTVKSPYKDWQTGEYEEIPAIKMTVQEA